MSYTADQQQKFTELANQLRNQNELRRKANGGNSILFTYPPHEESLYLQKAQELMGDTATFVDVSRLLVAFIDEIGWDEFARHYETLRSEPHKVFNSQHDPDLFHRILSAIQTADNSGKVPTLIRTGALLGTGIENVNIMEHSTVMKLKHPLVIFYPAVFADDQLLFLNFKSASKYRCAVVK
jgi:hypothetical protein